MSDDSSTIETVLKVKSSRFGELEVADSSIIYIPSGLIGFPRYNKFVMFEHKPPFSWLHSIEDENLAFVVVDGFEFGKEYDVKPPINDKDCDFKADDEFALLVVVTVRSDPRMTTVNLKAPVFVNMRNRHGVQVIIDDARFSTRHPLWSEDSAETTSEEPKKESSDK